MSTTTRSPISYIVENLRATFDRAIAAEAAEFQADLAYLQGFGAALIEHAGHRLPYPDVVSQWEEHLEQTSMETLAGALIIMSPRARAEILWPVI